MLRRLLDRLLARFCAPTDAEIARELQDHLDLEAEARGSTDPRWDARRRFGNLGLARESTRDVWHWMWLEQLAQDVKHGLRALRRSPLYAVAAAITLALGIGVATTMFSLTDAITGRPYPLLPQHKLLWIAQRSRACPTCLEVSPAAYAALRDRATAIRDVAAVSTWKTSLRTSTGSLLVSGYSVTPNLFTTIEAPFALGHGFPAGAGRPVEPDVIVLSYEFWKRQFSGSRGVIDSIITVAGKPHTVVGILAKDVSFPQTADVYGPREILPSESADYGSRYLAVFARLTPGATMATVAADAARISAELVREAPKTEGWMLAARPVAQFHTDDVATLEQIANSAALLVFLAACMSAANLCLARTAARRNELALRGALGVKRWRLARHLLTEALLVALVGGAVGVAFAEWGISALRDAIPASLSSFVPGWAHVRIDGRTLAFALAASVSATLAFALLPALRATRVNLSSVLSDGGRASTGGMYGTRTRATLVVLEVSIALVLMTAATLLTRSVINMTSGDPGVRREHVLTMHLSLPRVLTDSAVNATYRRLDDVLGNTRGVRAAGLTSTVPLSNNFWGTEFTIPGRIPELKEQALTATTQVITPNYLNAAGISLVAGRGITNADVGGAQRVVVVSKLMAERMWPKTTALGMTVVIDSVPWTVVGIAADVHHGGLDENVRMTVYRSAYQSMSRSPALTVWTDGDPDSMRDVIRSAIARVEPLAAVGEVMTMREMEARHVSPYKMMAALLSVLAIISVAIATVGLYGLIAYGVAQRVREIGLRIALGARASDILSHVGGGALRMATVGIVAGVIGALLFTRLLGSVLYGVAANDSRTLIGASLFLLTIALVAALVPAWRASRVSPMVALRE